MLALITKRANTNLVTQGWVGEKSHLMVSDTWTYENLLGQIVRWIHHAIKQCSDDHDWVQ
jgi:hypothetical protein